MSSNRYQHLVLGAKDIAQFIFGDSTPKSVGRIRHGYRSGTIPIIFKAGGLLAVDVRDYEPWLEARKAAVEELRAKRNKRPAPKPKPNPVAPARGRGRPRKDQPRLRVVSGGGAS